MFSFHSLQQSVPLCTQEIWWVILHLCWQWETILLCIEDQNHTRVWAIAKIKNNQPWKETGVIMLSKIMMHINYTAVKGMCLSSLAKASAISVESVSSGILSPMSQRFVFGFALCRTHPFYLSSLKRTDFFSLSRTEKYNQYFLAQFPIQLNERKVHWQEGRVREHSQIVRAFTALFYSHPYWRPLPEDVKPVRYLIEESKSSHHTYQYQLTLNPAQGFLVTQAMKKLFVFNSMRVNFIKNKYSI